ncbi:glycoside hydrolase family 47 protein [Sporobolomyces koalae]|uniref:glycoside hydrolase family 47 protein n=1 Tax=Sporobolomyces koalae TaxID=500713 RepID=UPI003176933E
MNSSAPGQTLYTSGRRSSYQPLASTAALDGDDGDGRSYPPPFESRAYNYDYEAAAPAQSATIGTSSGAVASVSNALSAAARLRGSKQKLLWITALACLGFVFHTFTSPSTDAHNWHPHLGSDLQPEEPLNVPVDFYDPPSEKPLDPPPPPPPSSDQHDSSSSSNASTGDEGEPDLSEFAKPRRRIRPSSPDPWSDVTSSTFKGRQWLSSDRFGSTDRGWQGMQDPPFESTRPPPARYLIKAYEYAVKLMQKDWNAAKMGRGSSWDEHTGRVRMIDRKWMQWIGRQGWKFPLQAAYKVAELGHGKLGEQTMNPVQTDQTVGEAKTEEARRETEREERRDWVKRAFLHAWEGYKKHAWGHDELSPVSALWSNNYNGWGATLVDNLDTLLIMNLSHEYNLARQHVSQIDFTYLMPSSTRFFSTSHLPPLSSLDVEFDPSRDYAQDESDYEKQEQIHNKWISSRLQASVSPFSPATIPLFETTIRYLGGLISAYDLSGGDPLMLQRAKELGDWLLPSLNTNWGLATPRYKIGSNPDGAPSGRSVLAEVGSLGMEMIRLSMITGDETYFVAAQRAMDTLETRFSSSPPITSKGGKVRGRLGSLLPSHINPDQPQMMQGEYTFGGLADSYYEYLIKQAQLTSFSNPQFERMYEKAIESAYEYLIRPVESVPGREHDLTTIGTMNWGSYRHELQHLTCFAGGMLGLGAKLMQRPRDLEIAKNFTEACVWVYESSTTGIGGEQTTFFEKNDASRFVSIKEPGGATVETPRGSPMGVRTANRKQIGRPETIESVFYMWRITGDRYWQDRGWQMFTSWVEHSITESGFATVGDVNVVPARKEDSMESFVTAETLKYYYLLFSPRDFISLDDFVFNTEAHPFMIPKLASSTSPRHFEPLWSGPEPELEEQGFVDQIGEGTWVQKWSRVLQASKLAKGLREDDKKKKGAGWFGGLGKGDVNTGQRADANKVKQDEAIREPVKFRKPIRPSEEELERAGKLEAGSAEEWKLKDDGRWRAAGGGGRGMGGGPPPI